MRGVRYLHTTRPPDPAGAKTRARGPGLHLHFQSLLDTINQGHTHTLEPTDYRM